MRRVILTCFSFSPLGELAAAAGGKLCERDWRGVAAAPTMSAKDAKDATMEGQGRDHERQGRDDERQGRDHERQGREHGGTMSAKAATKSAKDATMEGR